MGSVGCTLWDHISHRVNLWDHISHRVHTLYLLDLWDALYGIYDPTECTLSMRSMECTLWGIWCQRAHTFYLWDAFYGICDSIECTLSIYEIYAIYDPIECTLSIYEIYGMLSMGYMILKSAPFIYGIYGMHSMGCMIP